MVLRRKCKEGDYSSVRGEGLLLFRFLCKVKEYILIGRTIYWMKGGIVLIRFKSQLKLAIEDGVYLGGGYCRGKWLL